MGEDFLRRRNDRFMRQRDAKFVEQFKLDLFSACTPNIVVDVCGTAVGEGGVEHEVLWTPESEISGSGPLRFYRGDAPAVELAPAVADHVRAEHRGSCKPIVAEITHVEREHGLVVLRVGSAA